MANDGTTGTSALMQTLQNRYGTPGQASPGDLMRRLRENSEKAAQTGTSPAAGVTGDLVADRQRLGLPTATFTSPAPVAWLGGTGTQGTPTEQSAAFSGNPDAVAASLLASSPAGAAGSLPVGQYAPTRIYKTEEEQVLDKAYQDEDAYHKQYVEALKMEDQNSAAAAQQKLKDAQSRLTALGGTPNASWVVGAAQQYAGSVAATAGYLGQVNDALYGNKPTTVTGEPATQKSGGYKMDASGNLQRVPETLPVTNGSGQAADAVTEEAAKLTGEGASQVAGAKGGQSKAAQTLIDIGVNAEQMVFDLAAGSAMGSPLVPMGIRSFGGGVQQAQGAGAGLGRTGLYAAASAAVEVLTEKMFDGVAGIYGKGAADDIVNYIVGELSTDTAGRAAWKTLFEAAGEGAEEVVSDLVNPIISSIYNGKGVAENIGETLTAKGRAQTGYDFLVGAILGFFGSGTQALTGNQSESERFFQDAAKRGMSFRDTVAAWDAAQNAANAGTRQNDAGTTEARNGETTPPSAAERAVDGLTQPVANETSAEAQQGPATSLDAFTSAAGIAAAPTAQNAETAAQEQTQQNTLPAGVGAASNNPGSFSAWQNESSDFHPINGAAAETTTAERGRAPVEVPIENRQGRLTSKHLSTLLNAQITTNEMADALEQEAASGNFSRIAYTDAAAAAKAEKAISANGWDAEYAKYSDAVAKGISSKDITTMGIALYDNAVNAGDRITALDIASLMIANAQSTAQAMQAMNMINRATPTAKLYLAVKSIENIREELVAKYGEKAPGLQIGDDLLNAYRDALINGDKDSQTAAWDNIMRDVASQIPANAWDKFTAFRYLSMLGNPKTHVRNFAGNLGFLPVRMMKNVLATSAEIVTDQVSKAVGKGGISRTKAFMNFASASDRALLATSWADFQNVEGAIQSGGKFNDKYGMIEEYRTIFKIKPLEDLRKFNTWALDAEDMWFSRPAYTAALAGYLKANGYSSVDFANGTMSEEDMAKARAYAVKEAQKATYRDSNAFSDAISKLRKNQPGDTFAQKAINVVRNFLVDASMPFKRTPANILVRGAYEYNAPGVIAGVAKTINAIRGGKTTAAEAIDQLSAGLTGVGILCLGMYMAAQGLVTGGKSDDDKENAEKSLQGYQFFAINIGNKSYTIDWLPPAAIPFFMGVGLQNALSDKQGLTFKEAVPLVVNNIADPMLEMSMLSGLQDILDSVTYSSDHPVMGLVSSLATNYLSQFIPTIGGQIERAFTEDQRQETYRYNASNILGTTGQYDVGKAANKIPFPGVEYGQIPYIDAWGRTQSTGDVVQRILANFISPGYFSNINTSSVDTELQRLYDARYTDVFPSRAQQSTKWAELGDNYLTPEEFARYETVSGQTALKLVTDFYNSPAYGELTDKQRAETIDKLYALANYKAKKDVLNSQGIQYSNQSNDDALALYHPASYVAFSSGLNAAAGDAASERDYDAVDLLISGLKNEGPATQTKVADSFKNSDELVDASRVGLDSESWYQAYDQWKTLDNTGGLTATEKARQFAAWVDTNSKFTDRQKALLKEQLTYSSGFTADTDKYDALTSSGLSPSQANGYLDILSGVTGGGTPSQEDVYDALQQTTLSRDEKVAVWKTYMKIGSDKSGWTRTYDYVERKYG